MHTICTPFHTCTHLREIGAKGALYISSFICTYIVSYIIFYIHRYHILCYYIYVLYHRIVKRCVTYVHTSYIMYTSNKRRVHILYIVLSKLIAGKEGSPFLVFHNPGIELTASFWTPLGTNWFDLAQINLYRGVWKKEQFAQFPGFGKRERGFPPFLRSNTSYIMCTT